MYWVERVVAALGQPTSSRVENSQRLTRSDDLQRRRRWICQRRPMVVPCKFFVVSPVKEVRKPACRRRLREMRIAFDMATVTRYEGIGLRCPPMRFSETNSRAAIMQLRELTTLAGPKRFGEACYLYLRGLKKDHPI